MRAKTTTVPAVQDGPVSERRVMVQCMGRHVCLSMKMDTLAVLRRVMVRHVGAAPGLQQASARREAIAQEGAPNYESFSQRMLRAARLATESSTCTSTSGSSCKIFGSVLSTRLSSHRNPWKGFTAGSTTQSRGQVRG